MLSDFLTSPLGITILGLWTVIAALGVIWFSRFSAERPAAATQHDTVLRVFRNSAIPIASQIFVRLVDLGVAIAILRLLGPTGNGQYAIAVVVWLYVKTISDFGLGLLATREVARSPERIATIIGATTLLRWIILGIALGPVTFYVLARLGAGSMADQSAIAIFILLLSIIPSGYSEAINSGLNGLERMDLAAWINIGVSLVRAPLAVLLGASALEVTGVALAAVVAALVSALAFHRTLPSISAEGVRWRLGRTEGMDYARESWPLLVNSLLVSMFFRVDVFVIEAFRGARALGIYDASYKLINLLTIVPAYATLAVFPLMSQRASDSQALARAQRVTTYSLVVLAWGLVFSVTALAGVAIQVLAGDAYLPEAATLLRILIWFAPLSFLNGVFQYVLVATGQQQRIVPAFTAAVVFNLAANLALVPIYGTRASAVLTVATEVVIFLAFVYLTSSSTVRIHGAYAVARIWRPSVAGILATGAALLLRDQPLVSLLVSAGVFGGLALLLRVVGPEEIAILRRLLSRGERQADAV